MATSVVMPALEMAQETGTVVSWLKQEGDSVAKGEPLLEIETDKATVEVEANADGVLAGVTAGAGDEIPVGKTIAWIVAPGEEPPLEEASVATGRAMSTAAAEPTSFPETATPKPAPAPRRGKISPKARRLAAEHGVDLDRVHGTGPDGTVTGDDILAAAKSGPEAAAGAAPLGAVARLMAERTTESWTHAPHFFLIREVDAGALDAHREALKPAVQAEHGVKLTHTDLLVALAARVLARHPRMNATWDGEGIRTNERINVGVAMAVEDGVVAAVIPNADTAALGAIALQRRDMAERARAGRLLPSDVAGGTFTISNLGMYRIDAFTAIIVPPQAGILAVGRIADRVVPVDGEPGIRPMMTITLSSDHRVVDGAQAAAFLNDLTEAIRDPGAHGLGTNAGSTTGD